MSDFIFPLRFRPSYDYHVRPRCFGCPRKGGRKHAGCDLYAPLGTEVLAMADGEVIRGPYYFYSNTYALEVKHDNGKVVRYGEIKAGVPAGVRPGARVRQGQVIGYVGKLNVNVPSPMLHLEMYQGTRSGALTASGNPYKRRADLMDPTGILDTAPLLGQAGDGGDQRWGEVNNRTSNGLNVRAEPATDATRLFSLSQGARFEVLAEVTGGHYAQGNQRSWYQIRYNGQEGYVAAYFVDADPPPPAPKPAADDLEPGVVSPKVKSQLNLRQAASTSAPVVGQLPPGTKVQIVDEVQGEDYGFGRSDWVQLRHGDVEGFAAGYYVDVGDAAVSDAAAGDAAPAPPAADDGLVAAMMSAPTTGASAKTAGQDGLPGGIASSQRMAETDLPRVLAIADRFVSTSGKIGMPAALLAAIASRESRCGAVLSNGWGDGGNAFGIMQVDRRHHDIEGRPDPDSLDHLEQAAGILSDFFGQVQEKHPDWSLADQLKGGVVAYNSGVGNVRTVAGMDQGTTGDDYGSDVIARAQYYQNSDKLFMFRG